MYNTINMITYRYKVDAVVYIMFVEKNQKNQCCLDSWNLIYNQLDFNSWNGCVSILLYITSIGGCGAEHVLLVR